MTKKTIEKIKKHLEEVIKIKKEPHSIAIGFALGTFLAVLPTFGLAPFIGLGIVLLFKKISKISLLISFLIWNPLILAALSPVSYIIGNLVLSDLPVYTYKIEILNQIFVHSRRFLVGSIILAMTVTIASYLLILILVYAYQRKEPKGIKEEVEELKETLKI